MYFNFSFNAFIRLNLPKEWIYFKMLSLGKILVSNFLMEAHVGIFFNA